MGVALYSDVFTCVKAPVFYKIRRTLRSKGLFVCLKRVVRIWAPKRVQFSYLPSLNFKTPIMASAETERELLSAHATVAEYKGVKEGRESMLRVFPQRPNKQWAEFQIIEVSIAEVLVLMKELK